MKYIETFCGSFFSEPITEILGGPEVFINKDSTINLTCLVRFAPEPPPIMLWSHNREVSIHVQQIILLKINLLNKIDSINDEF